MVDRLCTTHAKYYDTYYSQKKYGDEVVCMVEQIRKQQGRVLIVGCGTGEHARHFRQRGWEVVGCDASTQMLDIAEAKCDAEFRHRKLPNIDVEGTFDLITFPGGVINYLTVPELHQTLDNAISYLRPDGTVIFDHPLPFLRSVRPPIQPWIETYDDEDGMYARVVQLKYVQDNYVWNAAYFVQQDTFEFFVESHPFFVYTEPELEAITERVNLQIVDSQNYSTDQNLPFYVVKRNEDLGSPVEWTPNEW